MIKLYIESLFLMWSSLATSDILRLKYSSIMEHFKEIKVKLLSLRLNRTNARIFALKTGLYTEEISSLLLLFWPSLSRSDVNWPRSESLGLSSILSCLSSS